MTELSMITSGTKPRGRNSCSRCRAPFQWPPFSHALTAALCTIMLGGHLVASSKRASARCHSRACAAALTSVLKVTASGSSPLPMRSCKRARAWCHSRASLQAPRAALYAMVSARRLSACTTLSSPRASCHRRCLPREDNALVRARAPPCSRSSASASSVPPRRSPAAARPLRRPHPPLQPRHRAAMPPPRLHQDMTTAT
mmetsp:Transcript_113120/g.365449  ORF Transcript_113120/g.365449 Transcript_113120/m.365449 type:complete len:200 (+) Transcript_113120:913-1512(+)